MKVLLSPSFLRSSVTTRGPVSVPSSAITSSDATLSDLWIMFRILRLTSSGTGSAPFSTKYETRMGILIVLDAVKAISGSTGSSRPELRPK